MLLQILDVDYIQNHKPVIRIFGRNEEGKSACCFYEGFEPYFYAKGDLEKIAELLKDKPEVVNIQKEKKFPAIGYRKEPVDVLKITVRKPDEVVKTREFLLASKINCEIFEADILFKYRFMIDNDLYGLDWIEVEPKRVGTQTVKCAAFQIDSLKKVKKEGNADMKCMAFDIECLPKDFTKPLDSVRDPIIIISFAFSHDYKGRKSLMLAAKSVKTDSRKIFCFSSEEEMLKRFIEIVDDYDPDIITGYNVQNFDIPYILERMRQNKISATFGRCTTKSVFSRKVGLLEQCTIPGRVVFDPYQVLKKDPGVRYKQYDLNTIARELLKEEKIDIKYRDMGKYWNGSNEMVLRFIEYAEKDAVLALKLVTEKKLIDKFFALAQLSGLLLQDTFGGQSIRVETKMMHEFRKRGILMPPRPGHEELNRRVLERDKMGLKGATVLDPKKGLHTEGCTLVLDFKSLYPSIIRTYNISPETILPKDSDEKHSVSPVGTKFIDASLCEGTMPMVLKDLLEMRSKVKKEMRSAKGDRKRNLDATQLAIKIMANSVSKDTDVVVRDDKGNIKILEIADLFDELSKGREIKRVGDSDVIELTGWESLSIENDRSCFMPMYAITRHRNPEKRLMRIRTRMGEVKVTKNHSIIEMKGRHANRERESSFIGLAEVEGKKVCKETVIAQVNNVEIKTYPKKYLDVSEIINELPAEETRDIFVYIPKSLNLDKRSWYANRSKILEYIDQNGDADSVSIMNSTGMDRKILRSSGGSLIERAGLTRAGNCSNVPVYSMTEGGKEYLSFYNTFRNCQKNSHWYCIPLSSLRGVPIPDEVAEKAMVGVGNWMGSARAKIPMRIPVTEDLAEIFGWFVSEGSSYAAKNTNSFTISIVNTDKNNQKRITELFEKVFGYSIRTISNRKQMNINTKIFYLVFRHLCGDLAGNKRIPDFIINSSTEIRSAFLEAYTKGDGDADGKRLTTKSKRLAAQLSFLMKEREGILHNGNDSGMHRVSIRKSTKGPKIVSGDLFGQCPVEIEEMECDDYVYDLSVRGTEKFVTAQGLVLHNSFYGYTGFAMARLYVLDIASSITSIGRQNLEITKKMVEDNFNYNVIYADTDSVFLETKIKNLDEAKKVGEEVSKYVTGHLSGYLELEFEKIFRTFLILTKKRYAGWSFEYTPEGWKDKIVMKGIETVRRDWCGLVGDTMNDILVRILKKGDVKGSTEYVKDIIQKLKRNEIPLEKLTVVKGITKDPKTYKGTLPHIELAKKLTTRRPENPPRIGDRIGFVIIAGNSMLSKRAEEPDYVKEKNIPIDADYYISCQLLPAVERILRAVGITTTELMGGGHQSNIADILNNKCRKLNHEIDVEYDRLSSQDEKKDTKILGGWEEFVCDKCKKSHRRMPLSGLCPCGGRILIFFQGSVASKCRQ